MSGGRLCVEESLQAYPAVIAEVFEATDLQINALGIQNLLNLWADWLSLSAGHGKGCSSIHSGSQCRVVAIDVLDGDTIAMAVARGHVSIAAIGGS